MPLAPAPFPSRNLSKECFASGRFSQSACYSFYDLLFLIFSHNHETRLIHSERNTFFPPSFKYCAARQMRSAQATDPYSTIVKLLFAILFFSITALNLHFLLSSELEGQCPISVIPPTVLPLPVRLFRLFLACVLPCGPR